jgi:hypothetical protein
VVAVVAGGAAERGVTGHASWAPAAVVVSASPSASPFEVDSPFPSPSPVYVQVPGPVRTVIQQQPTNGASCTIVFAFESVAWDACKFGAGETAVPPTEPNCQNQYGWTSSGLERACLWGEGRSHYP